MFREDGFRPNDQRGFVHKKLLGLGGSLIKRFVPAVGVASDIFGGVQSLVRSRARPTVPRSTTARPSLAGQAGKELARNLKFGEGPTLTTSSVRPRMLTNGARFPDVQPRSFVPPTVLPVHTRPSGPCAIPNTFPGPDGVCRPAGDAAEFGFGVGAAVMGQYGAALQPGRQVIERSVCLPGMQLAKDGFCYNKGAITNSQRMWPRGRRPLLTGGDMRAISIAARAGSKLERTTKRLRTLGMMKRLPAPRRTAAHAHARPVAAVSVS